MTLPRFSPADPRRLFALTLFVILSVVSNYPIVAQSPAASISSLEQGINLYRKGDFAGAVKALSSATKQNKVDVEAWHFLGLALRRSGEQKKARKAFETALKLQPNHTTSRIALADTLISLGKMEEADDEANRAVLQSPTNAEAHFLLGKIDLIQRRCGHVTQHIENALKHDPQLAPAYLLKTQVILCGLAEEYGRGRTLDALSAEKPPAATQETKTLLDEKRKGSAARYAEAAANLQKFIELSSSNEDLSLWKEQLETLKAYSNTDRDPGSPRTVFYHNEVTTKVRVLEKPEPAYTARAKETGVVGTVVLRAVFSADGTVKHILVLSGVPYGLTQQAVSAAKRIRFEPATLNGNKVSTFMQLEYNFNLY